MSALKKKAYKGRPAHLNQTVVWRVGWREALGIQHPPGAQAMLIVFHSTLRVAFGDGHFWDPFCKK